MGFVRKLKLTNRKIWLGLFNGWLLLTQKEKETKKKRGSGRFSSTSQEHQGVYGQGQPGLYQSSTRPKFRTQLVEFKLGPTASPCSVLVLLEPLSNYKKEFVVSLNNGL